MAVERTISTDRLPPQAVDVERAVLSAMLIDSGAVGAVVEVLSEAAFYHAAHRKIYAAVISLYEKGQPVDQITVVQELARRQQLEEVGGAVAVAQLAGEVGTSANAEYHAKIVQEKALRREMINISSQVATECYAETEDAFQLLERAEQRFFGLSQGSIQRGFKPLEGILHETFELVERAHKRAGALSGLTTGYRELDELTAGLQASDLIIVAGRPSMGKTAFGLCIARNVAVKEKVPVGVFSLEMSEQQIAQRLLCAESRVDSHRLRTGRLSDEEWMRLAAWSSKLVEAPLFIDDTPGISVLEMRAKARRLKAEHGVGLIIVDYLQLVTTHERIDNREQEIAKISRSLKALSKELNIPIIACAQLSRAVETRGGDKRPILSDLRESGCLSGESLVVMADTGMRVPIRQLAGKKGFKVWALNEETLRLEAAEVTHAFCTGTKPVYRLETGLGRTIRATGNHKFRTLQGWKRLDELSPGERIALPRTIPSGDEWHEDKISCPCSSEINLRATWNAPGCAGLEKPDSSGAYLVARELHSRATVSVAVGGDSQIACLASSDIYWDEVWKVEPAGEEDVFDLTVPSHSNFLANDIVVHNSIEQDADVVMFLYRPEVYGVKDDEGNDQEGVAEVIIGKQRNGPLGTVTLTWLAEYGRFEEPEMYREEPF